MFVRNPYFLYVNSRERLSGTDSDFTYAVNYPEGEEFTHCVLLNALIPKSYYLIQNNTTLDDKFQLDENGTTVTITVPLGNYTLTTFKNTIGALLTAASPNGLTYTLSYPANNMPDTGRWTYAQNNAAIQSTIICNEHLYEPFGLLRGSTNAFIGATLTSTAVIKMQSEDRLLISSSLINNGRDSILASINSTSSINYSSINYECPDCQFYSHQIKKQLNTVSFTLTDEDFEVISTNGLNINLSILFYRADPVYDQIRDVIKMILLEKK